MHTLRAHRGAWRFAAWLRVLSGFAFGACLAVPAAAAGTAPVPIDTFFSNPVLYRPALSPSGRYLAALQGAPGRRDMLVVVDLRDNKVKLVAGYTDIDVFQFQWVNDKRLLFNLSDKQVGPGGRHLASGLFAVDRDGGNRRQLAHRRNMRGVVEAPSLADRRILPWHTFMLNQPGAQDSDKVYVTSLEFASRFDIRTVKLLHLDTVTGRAQAVRPPGLVDDWLLDNAGEPRLAIDSEDGTTTLHYREPASGAWRSIAQYATYDKSAPFTPVGFGSDGTLYVRASLGKDTSSLHSVDLSSGKPNPEPLVTLPGYDFTGALLGRPGKLLGVSYETDAVGQVWFDKDMQAVQRKLDALLPGTVNLITVASRPETPWVLVSSFSDLRPLAYRLYNAETGALNPVGNSRPGVDPARMGRQEQVRYTARDGREIPALLTLPPGAKKKLPLVMLVHGGPFVRGNRWGWNAETQFLASRGYAVLAPDFRGSSGYGSAHFRAGWKQWGLAMQDDIADGARWAAAEGIADPARVCIAGASYGGYAALMGLVNDPDLYKCAINWVGVTDINLLYQGHWSFESDLPDEWKSHGMPKLVGDQVRDAAQLKATSPLEQAARITQPLLMAYGAVDRRVPLYHGTRFRDAVQKHNKQVEWVVYPDEGHGWSLPATRIDFWGRVERFLDRHIGAGAGAVR
jgi:dipeptidyl aminopeptidase/acylaminoacyl peptidase